MIGVRAARQDYRVAVAELPLSLRHSAGEDADIVVASEGDVAVAAASVVVITDPRPGDDLPASTRTRVVIDRPWLRADAAADAGAHPEAVLFTAECWSSAAGRSALMRDAVGWLRVLSGEELVLDAVATTPSATLARLRAGRRPATLIAHTHTGAGARARLRATAIGERRIEVVVDGGDVSIDVSTDAGTTRLPVRAESRQRHTLRRAVGVVKGATVDDAHALSVDDAIVRRLLEGHHSH